MNICYISIGHISRQRGGIDRVTDVLSKEFIKRGHNVLLVSLWQPIKGDEVYDYQHFLPSQDVTSTENKEFLRFFFINNDIEIIINQAETESMFQLIKMTHENIPLISCIHTDPLAPLKSVEDNWDLWRAKEGNIKFTFKYPYYLARYYFQKYTRYKHLSTKYRKLYEGCNAVVLLSNGFKKPFCRISDIKNTGKLYAIGNPDSFENVATLQEYDKKNIVLFVGRLDFSPKRCDRMLKIWKQIEEKTTDWELIILGDGPDREMFYAIKKNLNLKKVIFTGTVNPRPYYKDACISCITSTHEGFSLATSESLQYGVIPIAFGSYEAINDIIDDKKTGFIIKPFNLNDFAQAILSLTNNRQLINKLQHNIAERENKFEKTAIADKWEKLMEQLHK